MALSCIVSEILNVKQWHALDSCIRGHSRSLKMATLDRSRMTSYQSTIVSISLTCTILEICDIEEYSDLEIQDR